MFLLRWFKNLVLFSLFIALLVWVARYPYQGKPLYEHGLAFIKSDQYKEGVKDIRTLVGGFLKTVGEEIQEDVSEKDQKKLDELIQEQVKKGEQDGD